MEPHDERIKSGLFKALIIYHVAQGPKWPHARDSIHAQYGHDPEEAACC